MNITRSPQAMGVAVLGGVMALSLYSFNVPRVMTTVKPGESLNADFSQAYQLRSYESLVKVAGVKVGVVTGSEADGDRTHVTMKLDNGTLAKLGTEPRAVVKPTTLLGGKYYVELDRDGAEGATPEDSTIPVERTRVPVELDKVASAVTPSASKGLQQDIDSLSRTLRPSGRKAVQKFVDEAPAALRPAGTTLDALRGENPRTDLTDVVRGLSDTAYALTRQQGQLGSIIADLDTTTSAIDDARGQVADAVGQGPSTLRATTEGLRTLKPSLEKLGPTAEHFRPSARALSDVLATLDPVLVKARPVLRDTRAVAADARPLVEAAVPATERGTTVLDDLQGPVLDRLNGPIKRAVLSPWHGTGIYKGGGNDHTLYEETGYLLANTADVFKFHDKNGAMGRLMAGVGLSSVGGVVNLSIPQYLEGLGVSSLSGSGGGSGLTSPLVPSSPLSGAGSSGGLLSPLSSLLGGL